MSSLHFSQEDFEALAQGPILSAGKNLFCNRSGLRQLHIVGPDIIATFKGTPDCTAVISRRESNAIQSACTCGFGYGACEHIVAAMLAANSQQAIQMGMDFSAAGSDDSPEELSVSPLSHEPEENHTGQSEQSIPATVTEIETIDGKPAPRLYLKEQNEMLLVELRFAYLDGIVEFPAADRSRENLVTSPSGSIVRLKRSVAREMAFSSRLTTAGLSLFRSGSYTPTGDPVSWVRNDLQSLSAEGIEIYGRDSLMSFKMAQAKPTMKLAVSSVTGSMTDCTMSISYGTANAPLPGVFEAVIAGHTYVKLSDGTTGEIPVEWIEKLALIFSLCEEPPRNEILRFRSTRVAALSVLESIADCLSWEAVKTAGIQRLGDYTKKRPAVPVTFNGTLREYQQAGYEWFYFLQEFGLGGCLADDMGLGKTVQALALLLNEKASGCKPKTSLLLAPTSLLFNWQREARNFAPGLLVMTYHGRDRKRFRASDMALADLVITTYGTVQREIELFETIGFNYVILDEAQAIKNPLSDTSRMVRRLVSRSKLALSGTPIENNCSELWSLFSFLNPGMLGSFRAFCAGFSRPIEKERSREHLDVLRKIISPCILRRTKSQVARELPPKTEIILTVSMTPHQRTLYTMTRDACRADVLHAIDAEGMDRSRIHILSALTRLRQICCHPLIVDPAYTGDSGKFDALDDLIENAVAEGHKALIFSQFVSVLDLVRARLDGKGIKHEYLTGQTADRRRPVDSFQQNPDIPVMLISLKAGGVGLNLTAADYVIMVDPWWNPAVENQAADRAYRIGQTKPVFVYKLIAEDSVEQRVVEFQKSKQELFDSIITAEQSVFKNLDREDIARLFE
jgi:non-specific serine/threonine protein kinase